MRPIMAIALLRKGSVQDFDGVPVSPRLTRDDMVEMVGVFDLMSLGIRRVFWSDSVAEQRCSKWEGAALGRRKIRR